MEGPGRFGEVSGEGEGIFGLVFVPVYPTIRSREVATEKVASQMSILYFRSQNDLCPLS